MLSKHLDLVCVYDNDDDKDDNDDDDADDDDNAYFIFVTFFTQPQFEA